MRMKGHAAMKTPVMHKPLEITDTVDWGPVPTMLEGQSHTSGKLLHKDLGVAGVGV